jgi:hypothetical protein
MSSTVLFGAAENIVEVPLFAELGGYGPFRGRRNIGVRDPLWCRVLTFNDGDRRNMIVVTDMISSGQLECRLLRMELAEQFAMYPESIMFLATHTHSGACVHSCDVGYGEPNAEFLDNWRRTVKKTAAEAVRNEENCRALAGKAPIRKPIGSRRTTSEDKHTDPEIRFVKFVRADGSVKALLHNHAMHGVVFGPQLLVSADWMGDANAKIKKRGLAEIPCFLYGTAGDINVIWTHKNPAERHLNLDWIGTSYVDDLEAALAGAEEIELGPCLAILKAVELPTEPVVAAEYRDIAEKLLKKLPSPFEKLLNFIHDRMIEMAVLAENGHDFRVIRDLQVLKMGDLCVAAVPGEPFLAVGEEIRARSKAKFPLAVSVANGDAGYYPTREMFEQYPSIFDCDDFGAFGFYEVWFGPGLLRPKFKPCIVEFLTSTLLKMENEL